MVRRSPTMISIMSEMVETFSKLAERKQAIVAGNVLFRQGDSALSLFVVTSEELRLAWPLSHGSHHVLQRARAGVLMAEAFLFAEQHHCDALAIEACHVLIIPRKRVNDALASDPALARAWAKHLTQELQRTRAQAEILSLRENIHTKARRPAESQRQRVASERSIAANRIRNRCVAGSALPGVSPAPSMITSRQTLPSGDVLNFAGNSSCPDRVANPHFRLLSKM